MRLRYFLEAKDRWVCTEQKLVESVTQIVRSSAYFEHTECLLTQKLLAGLVSSVMLTRYCTHLSRFWTSWTCEVIGCAKHQREVISRARCCRQTHCWGMKDGKWGQVPCPCWQDAARIHITFGSYPWQLPLLCHWKLQLKVVKYLVILCVQKGRSVDHLMQ